MTLPQIEERTIISIMEQINLKDTVPNIEKYREIFEEQPLLRDLFAAIVDDDNNSIEHIDGYARALYQVYYLLKAQDEINGLESPAFGETCESCGCVNHG